MEEEYLQVGVDFSEKALCNGSFAPKFFMEGAENFFLRTAANEDVGSICVDGMEPDGD